MWLEMVACDLIPRGGLAANGVANKAASLFRASEKPGRPTRAARWTVYSLGRRTRARPGPGYPPPRDFSMAGRSSGAGGHLPIRNGVGGLPIKSIHPDLPGMGMLLGPRGWMLAAGVRVRADAHCYFPRKKGWSFFLKLHKIPSPPSRLYRFDFVAVSSIYRKASASVRHVLETATNDDELNYENPPTPCLWQAPASTQKTRKPKGKPGWPFAGARGGGSAKPRRNHRSGRPDFFRPGFPSGFLGAGGRLPRARRGRFFCRVIHHHHGRTGLVVIRGGISAFSGYLR